MDSSKLNDSWIGDFNRSRPDMEEAQDSHITPDTLGDLLLLVDEGEHQVIFRVSSKAMSLASPVWRVMLDPSGPFKEARPENDQVLFPEDDAQALLIVLCIAHLEFRSIPEKLNFTQLLNLAITCNKYDTGKLILTWFSKWEESYLDSALDLGYEQSLLIAWIFRDLETFKRVADELVRSTCVNSQGECLAHRGFAPFAEHMPPGIIESILKGRLATIQALTAGADSFVSRYKSVSTVCHGSQNRKACHAMMYGSLIMMMEKAGLQRISGDSLKIKSSLTTIYNTLNSAEFFQFPSYGPWDHFKCNFQNEWNDQQGSVLRSTPRGYTRVHSEHFK